MRLFRSSLKTLREVLLKCSSQEFSKSFTSLFIKSSQMTVRALQKMWWPSCLSSSILCLMKGGMLTLGSATSTTSLQKLISHKWHKINKHNLSISLVELFLTKTLCKRCATSLKTHKKKPSPILNKMMTKMPINNNLKITKCFGNSLISRFCMSLMGKETRRNQFESLRNS